MPAHIGLFDKLGIPFKSLYLLAAPNETAATARGMGGASPKAIWAASKAQRDQRQKKITDYKTYRRFIGLFDPYRKGDRGLKNHNMVVQKADEGNTTAMKQEWDLYFAKDTVFDKLIRELLAKRRTIWCISRRKNLNSLKRIETVGPTGVAVTLWSNEDGLPGWLADGDYGIGEAA